MVLFLHYPSSLFSYLLGCFLITCETLIPDLYDITLSHTLYTSCSGTLRLLSVLPSFLPALYYITELIIKGGTQSINMGSISPSEAKPTFPTPWIETPLVESASLSRAAGCRIFLKLENVQPSGSFKSRAMGNQILSHLKNPGNAGKPVHFYASSGGNAGLAAVCAARDLGYPCTVALPTSTKPLMVERLWTAGAANVVQYGDTIAEAGEYMREVLMKEKEDGESEYVVKIALHPFDNEPIWHGNGTIVGELAAQMPAVAKEQSTNYDNKPIPLDAIICSVGGGGLINGLIMGLERERQKKPLQTTTKLTSPIHLLAIETLGTDSLAQALAQKSHIALPKITSQATSLGATRVSEKTYQYALSPPPGLAVHTAVLSDADAARGVLRLVDDERLLVELACGVCVEVAVGDAARMSSIGKKRKRGENARDEGYGDDRSSVENESDPEEYSTSSSSSSSLQSKLKDLVPDLNPESRVVIIVCGGSNVSIDVAVEWRKMLREGWGEQ